MAPRSVQQYLTRHAEPEVGLLTGLPGCWRHSTVIPCCGERPEDLEPTLQSLAAAPAQSALTVLVINARADAPEWVHATNARLLRWLADRCPAHHQCASLPPPAGQAYLGFAPWGATLVVDRAQRGRRMGRRGGVGWARKIGVDLCVGLHARQQLDSPRVHVTDADVRVPEDYFARPRGHAVAWLYPFAHWVDDAPESALRAYEQTLRYYVAGLRWAGSPYAHHSIGSTFVVDIDAYCQVRGFPKRQAGEDFHLIDKLAKVGTIVSMGGHPIRLSGRASARVPFGTGPAVARIAQSGAAAAWPVYHPDSFVYLRALLEALPACVLAPRATQRDAVERCPPAPLDGRLLWQAVESIGLPTALAGAAITDRRPQGRWRQSLYWFDGMRTLRLIHALRDARLGTVPLAEAIQCAPFAVAPDVADTLPWRSGVDAQ